VAAGRRPAAKGEPGYAVVLIPNDAGIRMRMQTEASLHPVAAGQRYSR
jgi:hypothetical protein